MDVFLEEIPSTFYRIKGTDEILHEIDESKHYDLFIVLDCGDTGRLEFSVPLFVSAGHTPVSYTHLDVYKRQSVSLTDRIR